MTMPWMVLKGLFIHDRTVLADLRYLTLLTSLGFHELDVSLPVAVLTDECSDSLPGLLFGGKALQKHLVPYSTDLNSDSEYGLSFDTLGRERV